MKIATTVVIQLLYSFIMYSCIASTTVVPLTTWITHFRISREKMWQLAKAAVNFTGAQDTWYEEDVMKEKETNEIVRGLMNLNFYNIHLIPNSKSNTHSDVSDEENIELDSHSDDDVLEENEVDEADLKVYLDKMAFKDIPDDIKKADANMNLEELCVCISSMNQYELGSFFQCCFTITHNSHFPYIFLKYLVETTMSKGRECHLLLDAATGRKLVENWIEQFVTSYHLKETIWKVRMWCHNENFERTYTRISIVGNYIRVLMLCCNEQMIKDALKHFENKLNGYPIIRSLMIRNSIFNSPKPMISLIAHIITRKLHQFRIDNCSFIYGKFNLAGGKSLTKMEKEIVRGLWHLNISKCAINVLDNSISLATGLSILNIRGFRFTSIPTVIYEMDWLRVLRLGNGKLNSKGVSSDIKKLHRLEVLGFFSNNLRKIPEPITEMGNLRKLIVSYNGITRMPDNMNKMIKLETLILDGNNLRFELGDCPSWYAKNNGDGNPAENIGKTAENIDNPAENIDNPAENIDRTAENIDNPAENIDNPAENIDRTAENIGNPAPPAIKSLLIRSAWLPKVPRFIHKMKTLVKLILGSNTIQSLHKDLGIALPKLEILILHNNMLARLPKTIEDMKSLRVIGLSCNCLTEDAADAEFRPPETLKDVKIYSNTNLKKIPHWIFNLKNLVKLNAASCGISEIPAQIGNLKELQVLKLTMNFIKKLPDEMGALKNLVCLDFSRNKEIRCIPDWISNLKGLKELIGYACSIGPSIPDAIGELTNLKIIHLDQNYVETITTKIGNLIQLEEFKINGNRVKCLPDAMKNLKWIKTFTVKQNQLSKIPDWIGNFKFLEILDVGNNDAVDVIPLSIVNLVRLKSFIARKLIKVNWRNVPIFNIYGLETLDLSENSMCCVSDEISALKLLKSIDFSSCKLQELPKTICSFQSLKSLLVQNNQIKTLPEGIFRSNSALRVLNVSMNLLTYLPADIYKASPCLHLDARFNKFPNKYEIELNRMRRMIKRLKFTIIRQQTSDERSSRQVSEQIENSQVISEQGGISNIASRNPVEAPRFVRNPVEAPRFARNPENLPLQAQNYYYQQNMPGMNLPIYLSGVVEQVVYLPTGYPQMMQLPNPYQQYANYQPLLQNPPYDYYIQHVAGPLMNGFSSR